MLIETMREWQFQQMENAIKALAQIVAAHDDAALTTYRDGGAGWSVLQVLCHMRDFEALFYERARMTVSEDMPTLPFPDPDQLAEESDYQGQDIHAVMAEWQATRSEYLAFLRARPASDWERPAQHRTRGAFTLHDQLFLTPWHDTLHTEQIARILAEKQTG